MTTYKRRRRALLTCLGMLASVAFAQTPAGLEAEDQRAIQALVTDYARLLAECDAQGYADLFVPGSGYFASGFRGHIAGRDRLVALVESERHCLAPADSDQASRRPSGDGPSVVLEVSTGGVRGLADLGAAEYQDEYVKTPEGWRFASRTVILAAEKDAGIDAAELLALQRPDGAVLADHYVADANGVERLRTSGVAIIVADGAVTGRAYLEGGGHNAQTYERLGPGRWRVASSVYVPPETP